MQGKIMFALGAAVGYVVGTRSGREAYDRLKARATEVWHDPRVQQKVSDAQDFAKEKIPAAGEKITQATKKAAERQKQKSSGNSPSGDGDGRSEGFSASSGSSAGTPSPTAGVTPSETEPSMASPYGDATVGNEGTQGNA